jgi:hypothetical protein
MPTIQPESFAYENSITSNFLGSNHFRSAGAIRRL